MSKMIQLDFRSRIKQSDTDSYCSWECGSDSTQESSTPCYSDTATPLWHQSIQTCIKKHKPEICL